ncbi:NAD(P)/FAD-dependent oxidoreductase [Thermomicrobium sp.]
MAKQIGRFDAIIVGARIAGCVTAAALAQRGWSILLVERAQFPRPTLSTHLFFSDTLHALQRAGLLEPILRIGAPRIRWLRFPYVAAPFPASKGFDFALCIRREVLDTLLFEAVRSLSNVTALTGARVTAVRQVDDRRWDVVVATTSGEWLTSAPLVIGADGRDSTVARQVRAPVLAYIPPLFAWYYTYVDGLPWDGDVAALAYRGDYPDIGAEYAAAFLFPCDAGLTLVGYGVEHRAFSAFRRDVTQHFVAGLRRIPEVWERFASARRVAPIRGTGRLPNFLRQASGSGWALVGDAGCHQDPHSVQGMGNAARSAWLLAEELARVQTEGIDLQQALARYARRRDDDLLPLFAFTTFELRRQLPDDIWERFEARTREDPDLASLRVAAMVHAVHPATVYTPERVTSIANGAVIPPLQPA